MQRYSVLAARSQRSQSSLLDRVDQGSREWIVRERPDMDHNRPIPIAQFHGAADPQPLRSGAVFPVLCLSDVHRGPQRSSLLVPSLQRCCPGHPARLSQR